MDRSRRRLLSQAALWACSAAASPFITPIAYAAAPGENRLVVIILRGAMDGLDVIRPAGDPDYAALRPLLSQGAQPDLVGRWGLHPALDSLRPLWAAGEFGAVHAVSTPYRDRRSHFDGQDILEAGTVGLLGEMRRDGWLNRMMQVLPGVSAHTAYAIGAEQMLILTGQAEVARWAPNARLNLSPAARRLMEVVTHDDPLFRAAAEEALGIVDSLEEEALMQGATMPANAMPSNTRAGDTMLSDTMPTGAMPEAADMDPNANPAPAMLAPPATPQTGGGMHLRLADFAASRLRGESRIASFSLGGWDTHGAQTTTMVRPLTALAETILALKAGLGPHWERTAVLCMTEFGRTVRENGSGGTDHGTGGVMLYAGGAMRGGQVTGDWPGLRDLYADRDLLPTRDLRAHAGWVMRDMFGLSTAAIEDAVFPGLSLDGDPRLLR